MYGSTAESIVGGGRKKKARKTMRRGGEKTIPNLFGSELKVGGEYMKKNGHGGAHRKGHVSRRRKSGRRKTARRR
jgi:hypothetical protein